MFKDIKQTRSHHHLDPGTFSFSVFLYQWEFAYRVGMKQSTERQEMTDRLEANTSTTLLLTLCSLSSTFTSLIVTELIQIKKQTNNIMEIQFSRIFVKLLMMSIWFQMLGGGFHGHKIIVCVLSYCGNNTFKVELLRCLDGGLCSPGGYRVCSVFMFSTATHTA